MNAPVEGFAQYSPRFASREGPSAPVADISMSPALPASTKHSAPFTAACSPRMPSADSTANAVRDPRPQVRARRPRPRQRDGREILHQGLRQARRLFVTEPRLQVLARPRREAGPPEAGHALPRRLLRVRTERVSQPRGRSRKGRRRGSGLRGNRRVLHPPLQGVPARIKAGLRCRSPDWRRVSIHGHRV